MRYLMYMLVAVTLTVASSSTAYAIVGCLSDIQDLASRADVIIVGVVEELDRTMLSPCTPGHWGFGKGYYRCGHLPRIKVKVERTLKGNVPGIMSAWVPEEDGFLVMSCDDRPPAAEYLKKVVGGRVTMFLEQEQANLWTLDGPNSIYDSEMEAWVSIAIRTSAVRMTIKLDPQIANPGQAIEITHKLSIAEGNALHGCFGSRNFWRFESQSSTVLSEDYRVFFPKCLEKLSLESGKEIAWKQTVVVPLDAALGEAKVRARIQILSDPRCPEGNCAHAFLESEPAILRIVKFGGVAE